MAKKKTLYEEQFGTILDFGEEERRKQFEQIQKEQAREELRKNPYGIQPLPEVKKEEPKEPTKVTENPKGYPVKTDKYGSQTLITPDLVGQTRRDIELVKTTGGGMTAQELALAQEQQKLLQAQGKQLAGQVGQFSPMPLSNEPLLDYEQGLLQGLVNFIPRAITNVGALSLLRGGATGAVAAAGPGSRALGTNPRALGTNPRALAAGASVAGGAGGLLSGINPYVAGGALIAGIASSMISEFKGQRTDTINAQKRVLDEGKQTMKDWATLAESDPANRVYYLSQYNMVAAQIDQAYRQMKYDTQRDLVKFETALPDLAEFEAFYAIGGERQALDMEMRNALIAPAEVDYKLLELANRRQNA